MSAPALVMVAPNGARRTRADHPALPMTISETALAAALCREAGAGAVHAHLRAPDGTHLLDAEGYRALIAAVRREAGPELVVQITSEAVGRYAPDEQRAVVEAVRPEAASIALREMIPDGAEPEAAAFYARCRADGIAVQHILYDLTDFERLLALRRRGVLPDGPCSILFVLGRYTPDMESDPAALVPLLAALRSAPDATDFTPMACAFGRNETPALAAALAFGWHARVGFENSLTRPDGRPRADNAESTAEIAGLAGRLGRTRPSREETLRILGGTPGRLP